MAPLIFSLFDYDASQFASLLEIAAHRKTLLASLRKID
ncbi:hypothetical protein DF16_orf03053 [Bacillus thuringiensis serovar kurstaki str. YBT-1520]|nr:hypothetical protein DF16_orf03053 [Bacillus thuringiensis serovar kurstaki str. YBT-1520]